jgi:tetratricopeptide (TPR) repeat protein
MLKGHFRVPAIVILWFCMSLPALAQVSWVGKFDDALRQAQSEGKLIVVDLYTDWCPPCREMAEKVYPDAKFITFSRSHVFMLLNAETNPEGVRLRSKFRVESYPTILALNAKGQEIQRLLGGRDATNLIHELQAIFDDPQPYNEYIQKAKEKTDDYGLQYRVGKRALDRKDYSLARLFLTRAAGNSNSDTAIRSRALLNLAVAGYREGKCPEALSALHEFERVSSEEASLNMESKLLRGRILIACKRYEEAQTVLTELLRSSRSREDINSARTALSQLPNKYGKGNTGYRELLDKAKQEFQKGKLEPALKLAEQASDLAPKSAEVHLLLATINFRTGLDESEALKKSHCLSTALNELRFARRLDPENMNIYLTAKNMLASKHLPQYPESPDAQKSYTEAETRFAQGLYSEAIEAYTKTIKLEPGFGKAYIRCGDCFLVGGKAEEALKLYQSAIVKSPLDASAYHFAADALRRLGKIDEARRYIVLSLLADPEYPLSWNDLEQVASGQGQQLQRHTDLIPIQFLLLGINTNTYDESIYEDLLPQTIPAWQEYVRSKLLWRKEKFAKAYPKEAFYHTSFDEELESLQAAVKKWESLKLQNPTLRDQNLDFLHQLSIDEQMPAFIYLELFTEEYRNAYEQWKKTNPEAATNYIQEYLMPGTGTRNSRTFDRGTEMASQSSRLMACQQPEEDQKVDVQLGVRDKIKKKRKAEAELRASLKTGPPAAAVGLITSVNCDYPSTMDLILDTKGNQNRLHAENYYQAQYGMVGGAAGNGYLPVR